MSAKKRKKKKQPTLLRNISILVIVVSLLLLAYSKVTFSEYNVQVDGITYVCKSRSTASNSCSMSSTSTKTTAEQYCCRAREESATLLSDGTSIRFNPKNPSCDYKGIGKCPDGISTSSDKCHNFTTESYIYSNCEKASTSSKSSIKSSSSSKPSTKSTASSSKKSSSSSQEKANPNTGSSITIITLVTGIVMLAFSLVYTKKHS